MAYMILIVKPFKSSMGPIFSNSGPYLDQKGGPPHEIQGPCDYNMIIAAGLLS
jgi:hypothetical protein